MVVGFSSNERFLALLVNHLSGPFQESFGCSTLLVHPRRSQNQSWEDFEASFSLPFQSLCVCVRVRVCVSARERARVCVCACVSIPLPSFCLCNINGEWVGCLLISKFCKLSLSRTHTLSHTCAPTHTRTHTVSLYFVGASTTQG